MAQIVIKIIEIYQNTFSPDHGWLRNKYKNGFCRYYPTCSEYTKQSVKKYGLFGLFKGFLRILRCNPFSKGGVDLP